MSLIRRYVVDGVAAGAAAGLAFGVYTLTVVTPQIEHLEQIAHGHGHEHVGLAAEVTEAAFTVGGGALWGIVLGACFGFTYFLVEPAIPTDRLKSYVLAAAGFLTVSVAPWLVLPPASPGVGNALSIERSMLVYAGMMVVGAVASASTVALYNAASRRRHPPSVAAAVAATPLAALAALGVLTPTLLTGNPPSDLASTYTVSVAVGQAGLWLSLAASFDAISSNNMLYLGRGYREPSTSME